MSSGPAPERPASAGAAAVPGGPDGPGPPTGRAARPHLPGWLFALGMAVLLEPPVLLVLWAVDHDLAGGHLLGFALVGGFFVSLPSLVILGLAIVWDRRLATGQPVPGLPPAFTGPRASRIAATALVVSTLLIAGLLALLFGAEALIMLPPLALSIASAWLMARSA